MKKQKILKQLNFVIALILIIITLIITVIINSIQLHKLENAAENVVNTPAPTPDPIINTTTETVVVEKPVEIKQPTAYYNVPLSTEVQDAIFEECDKYHIPYSLIVAMIEKESNFDHKAIGDSGNSLGLMQIQERYHKDTMISLGCSDLLDPIDNVRTGIYLVHTLLQKDNGVQWALMAYNGGESYATKKINNGVITNYAIDILTRSFELEYNLY